MASSSEDATLNFCRFGKNFYQGQTSNGRIFGYGTLFDEKQEQFIIGFYQENQLIELRIAQFLRGTVCCNIKKFKDHYLFDCEKENFIAKLFISAVNNIDISEPFDKIYNELCSKSKIVEIYEDDLSKDLIDFCDNLEETLSNVNWNEIDDNKPLEFYDFFQLLKKCSTSDTIELIRKIGTTPMIFGDMTHKRVVINNNIVRRNQIFKFSNNKFKVDIHARFNQMLEKLCEQYRVCLLETTASQLKPHIETLQYPSLFLIRISDVRTLLKSIQVAKHYNIPFNVDKVFQLINRPNDIPNAVPTIMKCYPHLLKALGVELTLLSQEVNKSYKTLFDEIIMLNKPIEMDCDTLKYQLRRMQLLFIRELLDYYKPGDSLKKKLYSGPHEDYSVYSTALKSKTIRYSFLFFFLIVVNQSVKLI